MSTPRRTRPAAPRKGGWMQTYTGRMFWPADPRSDEISIVDIAHALSLTCRYGGHVNRFYSVAEHSVLVSDWVAENAPPEAGPELAAQITLWALLHDASEAYCADIVRPLKPHLAGYAEIEARLMAAVCRRFGLPPEMPALVHLADGRILADEKEALMGPEPAPWVLPGPPLGVTIHGWPPERAEREFSRRFVLLMDAISPSGSAQRDKGSKPPQAERSATGEPSPPQAARSAIGEP